MKCQHCQENPITVRVIDIPKGAMTNTPPGEAIECREELLCDACAKALALPIQTGGVKSLVNIVQLLKHSATKARKDNGTSCPQCGMTLTEFRAKGRLGCPRDYEVFGSHLEPLLRRVHNATRHVGRLPGIDEDTLRRKNLLNELRTRLEVAIREEQYENAARLRDEIHSIESKSGTSTQA